MKVVVSPHPDDAVFSAWHLLDGAGDVRVVNVFTALPPEGTPPPRWDRLTGASDSRQRMRERLAEDTEALGIAGRSADSLGFLDSQYRNEPLDTGALEAALERAAEDGELVAPVGIGDHSDHVAVRDAALALAERGAEVSFYAELPYATEFGWPAWVDASEPNPHVDPDAHWSDAWAPLFDARYAPIPIELDEAAQRRKIEAMRAYRTQFPALEGGELRRLTSPNLVRYEVLFVQRTA
jgi:LmbE family N-acetylglucosaminyl deacetylase